MSQTSVWWEGMRLALPVGANQHPTRRPEIDMPQQVPTPAFFVTSA